MGSDSILDDSDDFVNCVCRLFPAVFLVLAAIFVPAGLPLSSAFGIALFSIPIGMLVLGARRLRRLRRGT